MPKSRSGIVREKYCIIKGTGRKLSPICSQHEVRETQTGDIWLARIYNKHLLREKGLEDAAEFCYAVLKDCQEKENVIYIQQVLETEDSNLIIQEKYDRTLPELVREECPVRWTTAEDIIRDVFTAVVEIYSDKFYTRSIRPEHIVCVDEVWKIQTLVFDTEDYYLRDDIVWVPDFASPEQRLAEGKLPASQRDEQLVWGLGILALYMFLGPSFDYQSITQDSHVPWAKIEKLCSEVMFKFMRKVLRVNFEERMRLNELVRH